MESNVNACRLTRVIGDESASPSTLPLCPSASHAGRIGSEICILIFTPDRIFRHGFHYVLGGFVDTEACLYSLCYILFSLRIDV